MQNEAYDLNELFGSRLQQRARQRSDHHRIYNEAEQAVVFPRRGGTDNGSSYQAFAIASLIP
jgi:hypothetical protein